ncbi:MAG: conjugal transfer protein TraG N-terminal domain-containing protein [Deltaproteobacteria bacterium]|nr:conjugal transfer protein TraG N-terminal domain-containing protein [Deltaproteobacteria bacterium]
MAEIGEIGESISSAEIGSVGHFVSALLQSTGLDGQASVLSNMSEMITSIGALIYLVSLVGALISYGVFGNYKKALYLVISPALFFFFLKDTIPVDATTVKFGNRVVANSVEGQETFYNMLYKKEDGSSSNDNQEKKVSRFYVYYDQFISSLVQSLVGVLLDTENREDMIIAGRERLFNYLLNYENKNPHFMRLLSFGLMGKCADPSSYANEAARITNVTQKEDLKTKARIRRENTFINLDHGVIDYLKALDGGLISPEEETKSISCQRLYEVIKKACHDEAIILKNKQQERTAGADGMGESDIPWKEVWAEVEKTIAGQNGQNGNSSERAVDVIAAFLLRNTMQKNAHSLLINQIYEQNAISGEHVSSVYTQVAAANSSTMISKMVYFAGLIPYIQGLILMVMTTLFPFFALFLLMPGRATVFFNWMFIWLWAKSWDVGFAIVVFFKDFLWQFTSRDINHVAGTINWENIDSIYSFISVNDPIATPNTYSTIISLITLSIPILTANLCLGAGHVKGFVSKAMKPLGSFEKRFLQSARRQYASDQALMIGVNSALYNVGGAEKAANNPGYTDSGVPIALAGDRTHRNEMNRQAQLSQARSYNTQPGRETDLGKTALLRSGMEPRGAAGTDANFSSLTAAERLKGNQDIQARNIFEYNKMLGAGNSRPGVQSDEDPTPPKSSNEIDLDGN